MSTGDSQAIQQFHQLLKAEQLDRRTLQFIDPQPQNEFALLRYMLFSSIGTTPMSNTSVNNSAISPSTTLNPNPNRNPNPTSVALPIPCVDEPSARRSTPEGAVGPPATETTHSASIGFQSSPNIRQAPITTLQNLTSRISKLENVFTDEIATYISINAGIHSQYSFLYDEIRQLEAGDWDATIWTIPSVKFVLDSAKLAPPSSDPLLEPDTSFGSPIFRTHPHGYNFFINFYPFCLGPAAGKCASNLFTPFPGNYNSLLQWPFSKVIHIGIRDKLDALNTWTITVRPDEDPVCKKHIISKQRQEFILESICETNSIKFSFPLNGWDF